MPDEQVTTTNGVAGEQQASESPAQSETVEKAQEAQSSEQSTEQSAGEAAVEKAQEEIRKLKLKIDGIEQEYSEEDVIKMAQMSAAAQKRFQEAAATRKQSEEFLNALKTDPLSVLSHPDIGVDVKKFAEDFLLKELEKAEMSPEQHPARLVHH